MPSVRSACADALRLGALLAAMVVCSPAQAQDADSDLTFSLGGSVWSGDFGAPTDSLVTSALASVRFRTGGLRLTANIPYMRIRSDGTIFTGISGTPIFVSPMTPPSSRVRKGLGDLTLGASYLLPSESLGFDLELLGRVKLPTASTSSGLSTGKTDVAGGVSISKTLGRITPMATITYRKFGNVAGWDLKDGVEISAGASYAVSDRSVILVTYEYARAATTLIDDLHEVVGAFSTPIGSDRLRLTAFVGAGLSNGAADLSGGASIGVTF